MRRALTKGKLYLGQTVDKHILTFLSSSTKRSYPSHTFRIFSNLTSALFHQSNSTTPFALTKPTLHHQPMARPKPPHPPSTTFVSLYLIPPHTSHTDTPPRNPILQICNQSFALMMTWLCLFKSSTRQMPSASSTRTWPRILRASSNAGSLHSNATWKSFSRKPLAEAEVAAWAKKAPAKNGGRVARVDFGAVRWQEKVSACGSQGRAKRTRNLIPKQRDLGSCCADSNLRSVETPPQFSSAQRWRTFVPVVSDREVV